MKVPYRAVNHPSAGSGVASYPPCRTIAGRRRVDGGAVSTEKPAGGMGPQGRGWGSCRPVAVSVACTKAAMPSSQVARLSSGRLTRRSQPNQHDTAGPVQAVLHLKVSVSSFRLPSRPPVGRHGGGSAAIFDAPSPPPLSSGSRRFAARSNRLSTGRRSSPLLRT